MLGNDKGCRMRRKGQQRGGLKVHGRQEGHKKEEVLGDLIIRLRSQRYISDISAWK